MTGVSIYYDDTPTNGGPELIAFTRPADSRGLLHVAIDWDSETRTVTGVDSVLTAKQVRRLYDAVLVWSITGYTDDPLAIAAGFGTILTIPSTDDGAPLLITLTPDTVLKAAIPDAHVRPARTVCFTDRDRARGFCGTLVDWMLDTAGF